MASGGPPMPPLPPSPPSSQGAVRRHHTITAASRTARAAARDTISEEAGTAHEQDQSWNDDEVVDQDWVLQGGLGAVGEKAALHRQSSLPTKYHKAFTGKGSRTGTSTPKTMNSLTAIAGHEGDEEDWERDMRGLRANDDDVQPEVIDPQQQNPSPLSPHFVPSQHVPSPPPAGAASVRRHVSLTYGAATAGAKKPAATNLKRSGTLQNPHSHAHSHTSTPGHGTPSPPVQDEEEYQYEYPDDTTAQYDDEAYYQQQQQQQTGSIGRSSPWNTNQQPQTDWRTVSTFGPAASIDDVQRALSTLELNSQMQMYYPQTGQSTHPPRFNPTQPPPAQAPGIRNGSAAGTGSNTPSNNGKKLQLVTDFDGRKTPSGQSAQSGPASASAYVPPIGGQQYQGPASAGRGEDRIITGRASNPNLKNSAANNAGNNNNGGGNGVPSVPPIPQQYLQAQQRGFGVAQAMGMGSMGVGVGMANPGFLNSPIDVPTLIATKGYNPVSFDTKPQFARYFVIKSYTEDDVHKSLKYEIWSSTDPGNKRLDKAFKETAGRGPIYLFFSVNASGHFCGMAEMLTPVDYTRSSTVWASDKWKGVFKVRWIFVRDIPNVNLRHIKLNNTQERKPVTNSRDTQELLPDAGLEMLRIFHTHPARTSLLQDFAFYELQSMQKIQQAQAQQSQQGTSSPPLHSPTSMHSPTLQPVSPSVPSMALAAGAGAGAGTGMGGQQGAFMAGLQNPNALAYQMPQMTPMMQMQMNMGMGMGGMGMGAMGGGMGMSGMGMGGMGMGGAGGGGNGFGMGNSQTQAMHASVMRHPSPGPGQGGQGFNAF